MMMAFSTNGKLAIRLAESAGRIARLAGQPASANPYSAIGTSPHLRLAWQLGWDEPNIDLPEDNRQE